ncbi:MAG: hypothetical protein WCC66_16370 [Rhizobiaceae bacterium]
MSSAIQRFETREDINSAILRLVEAGVSLDDVDVELARIGLVDLDLCVECLDEMAATLAAKAIAEALEAA